MGTLDTMKQIFVVEDDHDIRELITYLLISENYIVKSFPNAESFIKTISAEKPDLVLMDVMLPDGNGQDICKDLQQMDDTLKIPVVLMSAHVDNIKTQHARDFISKPFNVDDFLHKIHQHLA